MRIIQRYLLHLEELLMAMADGRIPPRPIEDLEPGEVPESLRAALHEVQRIRHLWGTGKAGRLEECGAGSGS
ncbi:hypothetical protein HNR42_002818 [Deinobacterium chartae]|uniref:Uncharacterized protein n=1 Tax=Deinobacterium chartae TaxID=521158 RepID=A0A841I123_9DEIO|nr:hypothetical protein [Deinobacterium chartae]MBB6099377.1 hypothetical protein [Deinobacterium chartae]